MNDKQFRFQDLEVWRRAAAFSPILFKLADGLDQRRNYRFAEQLRAATLSITNNIAEGSGSSSNVDFANFLNIARRSVVEVANMLIIFTRKNLMETKVTKPLLADLAEQTQMISAFIRTL